MDSFRGRTALITGASSGLGVEFARQLAAQGCNLVLVARREEPMRKLAEELTGEHDIRTRVISLDLARPEAAGELHDQLQRSAIDIDVLINNAGFGMYGRFEDDDPVRLRDMQLLNMVTLTELTRLFLEPMKERGEGRIIQIGSIASFQPGPLFAAYSATKAYVLSLGEALNEELRGTGVRCTVVCPGVTATEFLDTAGQQGKVSLYQRLFMMESPAVVRAGLRASLRGRSSVVTGVLNKLQIFFLRFVSRGFAARAGHIAMKM